MKEVDRSDPFRILGSAFNNRVVLGTGAAVVWLERLILSALYALTAAALMLLFAWWDLLRRLIEWDTTEFDNLKRRFRRCRLASIDGGRSGV